MPDLAQIVALAEFAQSAFNAGLWTGNPPDFAAIGTIILSPGYTPKNKGYILVSVTTALFSTAIVCVVLRICSRIVIKGRLGIDDVLIIVAMIWTSGYTAIQYISVYRIGMGKHTWDQTLDQLHAGYKMIFAHTLIYITSVSITKLSIISFISQIASPDSRTKVAAKILFAFHILFLVITVFIYSLQCRPLQAAYNVEVRILPGSRCLNQRRLYFSMNGIHLLADVALLILLAPMIWKLTLPRIQRISVLAAFSLGALSCGACGLRVIWLNIMTTDFDIAWNSLYVSLWGEIEVTLGIICASIPALRPLLKVFPKGVLSSVRSTVHKVGSIKMFRESSLNPSTINANKNDTDRHQGSWVRLSHISTAEQLQHEQEGHNNEPPPEVSVQTLIAADHLATLQS